MNKKAYISVSFSNRRALQNELKGIADVLTGLDIIPFIFVDQYKFSAADESQMMTQAIADIDECDFLIAETSEKAIGVGVEVGYAKGKGKPVFYLRRNTAEHSTTVSGVSDFQVIYHDQKDLQLQLKSAILKFLSTKK